MSSLEKQIQTILDDFDTALLDDILDVLQQMAPLFKSELVSEYLQNKIQKIRDSDDNDEAKKRVLCKALRPYLDWYQQGL